jgi:hypothetical protein
MNKQDIIKKLANPRLDDYERESLCQLLHYLNVEGINNTSSTNTHKRTSDKRTSSNYKGKNPRHTSSTNTSSNTR